jgi:hypothetical protein
MRGPFPRSATRNRMPLVLTRANSTFASIDVSMRSALFSRPNAIMIRASTTEASLEGVQSRSIRRAARLICLVGQISWPFLRKLKWPGRPFGSKSAAPENSFHQWLQIDARNQPRRQKNSSSVFRKFMIFSALSRLDRRGVRVVTDVGRDAMDAERHHLTRDAACGRQKRVVPIPRCWDQACG